MGISESMPKESLTRINTKWLLDQLKRKKMSQRQLAKALGLDQSSLNNIVHGKRKVALHEAARISQILGIPLEEFMEQAGLSPAISASGAPNTLEIKGWVDGAFNVVWGKPTGPSTVETPDGKPRPELIALRCQTAGSAHESLDGALLFYYQRTDCEPDVLNRLCVVNFGSRTVLRVVKRGYETGKHNLALINGAVVEESVQVESASPIDWMKLKIG